MTLVKIMDIENKIKEEIEKVRPYLQGDGGDVEFVKFENGDVYVKLSGACQNCSLIDFTLKDGIEEILVNEIPEVKSVIQVQE
jgi:Fe-S cluster biogenesis protein NfuA